MSLRICKKWVLDMAVKLSSCWIFSNQAISQVSWGEGQNVCWWLRDVPSLTGRAQDVDPGMWPRDPERVWIRLPSRRKDGADLDDFLLQFLVAFQDTPEALPAPPAVPDSQALSKLGRHVQRNLRAAEPIAISFKPHSRHGLVLTCDAVHSWILHILCAGTWWFDWFDSSEAGDNSSNVILWWCRENADS